MREHLVADMGQHFIGAIVAPCFPAAVLVGRAKAAEVGLSGDGPALFVLAFLHVEQAAVHEEGDLLDDGERVGDAASPEFGPEAVDTVLKFAGDHVRFVSSLE